MARSLSLAAHGYQLLHFLNDLHQSPTLCFAQRAGFVDADNVADAGFVFLVVSMETGGLFNELTVNGVFHLTLNGNGDGFIHLVAGNYANSFFA